MVEPASDLDAATFSLAGLSTPQPRSTRELDDAGPDLGPLSRLVGTWEGAGFNTIWRPHYPAEPQDRFLELNSTRERLVFTANVGKVPNRGLRTPDIEMVGITYVQSIADAGTGAGLHLEPGIWLAVPETSDPRLGPTVARMGSIPHGTTILAQGAADSSEGGPVIDPVSIVPFLIGGQPLPAAEFPELDLATPTDFRSVTGDVTQAMVDDPNIVVRDALAAMSIDATTSLRVATSWPPAAPDEVPGGGTSNTAFLESCGFPPTAPSGAPDGNAATTQVDATFWITDTSDGPVLSYTQNVRLDFNGLSWPHVTVAVLHPVAG